MSFIFFDNTIGLTCVYVDLILAVYFNYVFLRLMRLAHE